MQSLYQTVLTNMAICCRSRVSALSQIRVRQRLSSDYLKPAVTDNLCRKGTWNRTKQLHNNSVFKHILYKNDLKTRMMTNCAMFRREENNSESDIRCTSVCQNWKKSAIERWTSCVDQQRCFCDFIVQEPFYSIFAVCLFYLCLLFLPHLKPELTDDECGSIKEW